MVKNKGVEEYLIDQHAKEYRGCDDDMPDSFNDFLCELGPDEWIELAEKWRKLNDK